VVFTEIDTFNRDVFSEWGIADALYIDGIEINTGPPPSYKDIKVLISKKVRELK